ncbi:tRNA(Ile)-lysidine synthase [Acinetobacter marinus]|uniref:tRNA(Ile)-lysidine synthase n=1 Tax=Acinetobacter marinus TaxID=281375 RepID=A0A1G6JF86_9GAMM|nr:tRNA lysidine(34) synthetase TilS [Acinetobacter marinus]SDC17369.1 tRNA(Ile)-lysidine synthase [Acinetobacter marinus]
MRSTLPAIDEVWQQQSRQRIIQKIEQLPKTSLVYLACSGGMDSMLLLFLFAGLIPVRLRVIHIDHQLQSESAKWSALVAKYCQQLAIPCTMIQVNVQAGNVEAEARKARYHAFERVLSADDILILGHHQQDQAETLLMRLFQGAGVRGLSAMREWQKRRIKDVNSSDFKNYFIWRPFLNLSKAQIQQWASQYAFDYVDDPMNHDDDFERVWHRQQLLPMLAQRIPHVQDSLSRTAVLMQDADQILQEVLVQDVGQCVDPFGRLNITYLNRLSLPRQRQLLSHWMQGEAHYRPPLAMVERLHTEVIDARQDANSRLHWSATYFMRYEYLLYRYSEAQWQAIQQPITASEIHLKLKDVISVAGQCFQIDDVGTEEYGLHADILAQSLQLMPRQGGEKIRLSGQKEHRLLKKMLQEAKIAPWLRNQIQILMYHNTPLGVFTPLGFWLADSAFVEAGGWLPMRVDECVCKTSQVMSQSII